MMHFTHTLQGTVMDFKYTPQNKHRQMFLCLPSSTFGTLSRNTGLLNHWFLDLDENARADQNSLIPGTNLNKTASYEQYLLAILES